MTPDQSSPFFFRGANTENETLAIISLKRDQQVPVVLQNLEADSADAITNTRFGSYPHTTLLDKPWGSQIIATNVNAKDATRGKKRKREESDVKEDKRESASSILPPAYEAASRGFAHIIPPTPELWTVSLPHRTQVVYTPDYSFILQKLRVRPGDTIIEAGAGSGSFTHAAARAVFNGYVPTEEAQPSDGHVVKAGTRLGKVCSFEYHKPRCTQLQLEIREHKLDHVVTIRHRDVYGDGFLLENDVSPQADVIFLDLPEPRKALTQLVRSPEEGKTSPLNPETTSRVCTFSPCIEQVQQTIESLQQLGWVEIITYELQHKRLDVRRDMTSLNYEGLRGVNASAANVEEALQKLRDLESKVTHFHEVTKQDNGKPKQKSKGNAKKVTNVETKQERLNRIKEEDKDRKIWREGRLVHRAEPELRTHTSYLTFAVLPRVWTDEDEQASRLKWATRNGEGSAR